MSDAVPPASWLNACYVAEPGAASQYYSMTAQPHGISTIIFFAYTLMIMGPEYQETGDYRTAWATGLFAATMYVTWLLSSTHGKKNCLV